MLEEVTIHGLTHHHVLVELDQKVLGLIVAHVSNLGFKGTQVELLFQGQFNRRIIHVSSP